MSNIKSSWFLPDKLIKDIIWNDLEEAARYSKGYLLDIGCGKKPYKEIFNSRTAKYIGLDPNEKSADINEDFYKSSISANSFDTILATQVLEHVPYPKEFLRKCNKILKTKGIIIISVPLLAGIHEEPHDYYRFTKYALSNLLENTNFSIVYIKEQGNVYTSLSFILCFYLEEKFNRFLLKYPKKFLIAIIQGITYLLSFLSKDFTMSSKYPLNYIVVARKLN